MLLLRSSRNTLVVVTCIIFLYFSGGVYGFDQTNTLQHLDKLVYERLLTTTSQDDFLRKLDSYEITYPEELKTNQLHGRHRRDIATNDESFYKISAFGKSYALSLYQNDDLASHGVSVEYFNGDTFYQSKTSTSNCYKIGDVLGAENAMAAISDCDGLAGGFQTEEGMVFIEPYENGTLFSSSNGRRAHLVYRQKSIDKNGKENEKKKGKEGTMSAAKTVQVPASVVPIDSFLSDSIINLDESGDSKRVRRDSYDAFSTFINKSPRSAQLYWLDIFGHSVYFITLRPNEQKGVNTFEDTKWIVMDEKTNIRLLVNNGTEFVAKANEVTNRAKVVVTVPPNTNFPDDREDAVLPEGLDRYVETMVIADDSVVAYHGKDKVERFVLTLMNLASRIFKDQSLGVRINFIITRLILMQKPSKSLQIINKNPSRSVISACNYAFSLQEGTDKDKKHFDFALILTRKSFGPSGYAPVYSMCTKSRSCALVEDDGFTSAFIAAHETGHTLGLEHDGSGNTCKGDGPKGSVMAPVVISRFDRYYWSECSRKAMRENLNYFKCLNDKPSDNMKYMKSLPGSYYTLDEQCEQNFGTKSKQCTAFRNNPCRMLWCTFPDKQKYCKTFRGPALDGSTCARGKWCLKGECVSNAIMPQAPEIEPTALKPVDGQWSKWGLPSVCSVTCGVGVQYRSRSCSRPSSANGGKPCEGSDTRSNICNTQKCQLTIAFTDIQNEQCEKLAGKNWKTYNDEEFNSVLRRSRSDVNCTFDRSLCNWENRKDGDVFDWIKKSGATPSRGTGPGNDHTQKNKEGSYMYIEASDDYKQRRRQGDKAHLTSPLIIVPRACFRMFYHMHGEATGALRLLLEPIGKDSEKSIVWETKGKQGDTWIEAEIQVDYPRPHKIIIEAERGGHYTSDIAIDDVSLVAGKCNTEEVVNPCLVSCRTNSASLFKLDLTETDGTTCYGNRSNDICIKGKCMKFGCDLRFDSDKIVDNCGICGGRNDTCEEVANEKYIIPKQTYEIIAIVPSGSTNIFIQDRVRTNYKIGIRRKGSNAVYFGDPRNPKSNYRRIAEATFHFKESFDGKQEITAIGPTSVDLEAVLYSDGQRRNRADITYFFYQLKSKANAFVQNFKYSVTGWTACSATCGVGSQATVVRCLHESQDKIVDESLCSGLMKQKKQVRSCNLKPCATKYRWYSLAWRRCSVTCDEGRQVRIVACINSARMQVVSGRLCTETPPPNVRTCKRPKCPVYKWIPSDWSACPVSCGGSIASRKVECKDITRSGMVPERLCTDSKPTDKKSCNVNKCDVFRYTSTFGACSKSCDNGIRVRLVRCINGRTGGVVEKKYCSGPAPPPLDACNTNPCPEFVWRSTEYGRCTQTCGLGQQRRNVKCTNKATLEEVTDGNCQDSKPSTTRSCIETKCPTFNWRIGTWSKCSSLCGTGQQKRDVDCIASGTSNVVTETNCKETKPPIERSCILKNCSNAGNANCDFEKDSFCSWKNDPRAVFEWGIAKETPSKGTGPLSGHNSGKFAYIEASSPRRFGDKAALQSPPLRAAEGCFTMWYYMEGSSIGRLIVYYIGKERRKALFQIAGKQGNKWKKAALDINLSDSSKGFQLLVVAERGQTFSGDIAIDDLSFQSRKCGALIDNNEKKKEVTPTSSSCRQISPLCHISHKQQYCKYNSYRTLCCETCSNS